VTALAEAARRLTPETPAPPRRRLPAAERRAQIVAAAEAAFADHGFALSTRDLAARLGVTQALLYRYYPSKEALVAEVLERRLRRRDLGPALALLRRREQPLAERLTAFYTDYLEALTATRLRLFVRANLDGQPLAARVGAGLTERVLGPVLAELRAEAGLPGLDRLPMRRGERELLMALHGAVVFLAIRRHVYRMPMPDDLGVLVALQVRTYLPGALAELTRLHSPDVAASLAVDQLRPRRRPA
jgi:AcrR family transcriptional regulator